MLYAVYEQNTGLFALYAPDGSVSFRTRGYAGRGIGRNQHIHQITPGVGPLPCGDYSIGEPVDHPRLGPLALPLRPHPYNKMFGRRGFFIHGDNEKNDASHGCIILPRAARALVVELDVFCLCVVSGPRQTTIPRSGD